MLTLIVKKKEDTTNIVLSMAGVLHMTVFETDDNFELTFYSLGEKDLPYIKNLLQTDEITVIPNKKEIA